MTVMKTTVFRVIPILVLAGIAVVPMFTVAAKRDGSGRVARITDGDTFGLESGERIRIARIDAPKTHRNQARCAGDVRLGARARHQAKALLTGRTVTTHRVGRSYGRTVATVTLDGNDVGGLLVRDEVASWWPRGRPKPNWCKAGL